MTVSLTASARQRTRPPRSGRRRSPPRFPRPCSSRTGSTRSGTRSRQPTLPINAARRGERPAAANASPPPSPPPPAPLSAQPPPRPEESAPAAPRLAGAAVRVLIEGGVLLLIALTPWAFGCLPPVYQSLLYLAVAALLALWAVRTLLERRLIWATCPLGLALA